MKKLLLSIFAMISFISFGQEWSECKNLETTFQPVVAGSNAGEYTVKIDVKNNKTEMLSVCNYWLKTESDADVEFVIANEVCVPINAGDTKTFTAKIKVKNTALEFVTISLKLKDGMNTENPAYCTFSKTLGVGSKLNLSELESQAALLNTKYYDLMGREVKEPIGKGFFIVKKEYEGGKSSVEKIYSSH